MGLGGVGRSVKSFLNQRSYNQGTQHIDGARTLFLSLSSISRGTTPSWLGPLTETARRDGSSAYVVSRVMTKPSEAGELGYTRLLVYL